jgi:hypothetical protein
MEGDRPLWNEHTLAMARGIVEDAKAVFVRPPVFVGGDDRALDTEILGVWFARMIRDFRGQNHVLDQPRAKDDIGQFAEAFGCKCGTLIPERRG